MKIRCPKCGNTQDASQFCANCGIRFDLSQPIYRKKGINWKVLIIIVVSVLGLGIYGLLTEESRMRQSVERSVPLDPDYSIIGEKPLQSSLDSSVLPVKEYLRNNLNDYDSAEFVEWSPVTKVEINGQKYWGVRLKLRAKNGFGAYILRDTYYFMRHGKVVESQGLN